MPGFTGSLTPGIPQNKGLVINDMNQIPPENNDMLKDNLNATILTGPTPIASAALILDFDSESPDINPETDGLRDQLKTLLVVSF
jgi:hypothetical protein